MAWNSKPLLERLDEKTVKGSSPSDCWKWTGTKNNMGYGMIQAKVDGKHGKRLAHRVSYAIRVRPISNSECVLHRCDNPECTNPDHLFTGSKRDNYADMVAKGRRRLCYTPNHLPIPQRGDDHWTRKRPQDVKRGQTNGFAKLTDADVRRIYQMRLSGMNYERIAEHFGLDPSTVGDILKGVRWCHLLGTDGAPTLAQLQAIKTPKTVTKLTPDQAREIKARLKAGETGKSIAALYKINEQSVSDIKHGKSWAWL